VARLKWTILALSLVVAGCSMGHPAPPPFHAESPEYIGRNCVASLQPDGTPDYSSGCTANDRLFLERRCDR
jgi:hypothetical protein